MQEENFYGDESDSDSQNDIKKQLKSTIKASSDNYDKDLMGDNQDREYLLSLTELEREKILMERHAKREDLSRKKELLDKLNKKKGEERYGVAVIPLYFSPFN